jgi:hypothetical protein
LGVKRYICLGTERLGAVLVVDIPTASGCKLNQSSTYSTTVERENPKK